MPVPPSPETRPPGIRLTNSLTRRKEAFAPLDPANVRMYVCGPTVYDRAHLGNARPVVVFDVLFRLLRHVYGADHVTYVRNFTDVDDKINAEALRRQQAGASGTLEALIRERTEETIRWYHEDMDALGALRPTHEPRATEYIAAMIAMIRRLIAQGHAYAAEGHVLFRVRSYRGYGALSGRTVDDMLAGARVEVAPFKEDPLDFVLWKPSDAALPGWDSPWGRGRPGWHIECSAMSRELLGESFDIHGGGLDLQFPHHENEIAQSRCAHPEGGFAKLWLHNEMLLVEGRKMSKSLGNFFTVRDLLNQHIDGEVIRYVFLMTHYRKPMDWTTQKLETATALLRRWGSIRHRLASAEIAPRYSPDLVDAEVLAALADDLNTPLALSHLIRLGQDLYYEKTASDAVNRFFSTLQLLGFERLDPDGPAIKATVVRAFQAARRIDPLVERLRELRAAKNWAEADKLRDRLRDAGLKLRMNKDGTIVWEHSPNLNMDRLEAIE